MAQLLSIQRLIYLTDHVNRHEIVGLIESIAEVSAYSVGIGSDNVARD